MRGNMRGVSLIFCQSPIKIGPTLVCYEKEKAEGNDVIIIARNTKSIYDFISSLHIDARVFWFDNHLQKKSDILKIKLFEYVRKDIKSLNLCKEMISHVYFSSICNDLLMGCYLAEFDKGKIIKLQGAVDLNNRVDEYNIVKGKKPVLLLCKKYILSYLLGYKIRIQKVGTPVLAIDMGYYRYPLFDGSDHSIYEKYVYRPKMISMKNALVFAGEFHETFRNREKYVKVFVECIKALQNKGYSVYVKGHPRLGTLKEALECSTTEIPTYIPAEFINYKSFNCAYGLMTAAICSTSFLIDSYSILPLSGLVEDERYNGWCDYLDKTSDGHVRYLHSFDEIN